MADLLRLTPPGLAVSLQASPARFGSCVGPGVPSGWQLKQPVRFSLSVPGEPPVLRVIGVVTWRESDAVGIAFGPDTAGDAALIHRIVRIFLERRK